MKTIYKISLKILLIILSLSSTIFAQVSEAPLGAGTSENPYKINSLDNLYWISQNPSSWDKYFLQTSDINAAATSTWDSNKGWTPIGNDVTKFTGEYNGANYVISNLFIDRPLENNVGLFGHVGSNTEATLISSLGITNSTISGARGVGALIGRVTGNQTTIIEYCFAIGCTITGDGATGGLIGSFNSFQETADGSSNPIVRKSYANNIVKTSGTGGLDKFGGLVGCSQKGSIKNSFARGQIQVTDATRVGGLAGCIDYRGDIEDSYATTEITANSSTNVGGLVGNATGAGSFDGIVDNSVWDSETTTLGISAGGDIHTTSEMKDNATYTGLSWDFGDTWGISAGVNNGYPFLYGDNNFILPIELISFEGIRTGSETIELTWKTASEYMNEGFEVQKSYNGTSFHTIAWIGGKGTSTIENNYSFTDYETSSNIVYYRLVQFDMNGDNSTSEIITVMPYNAKEIVSFSEKKCTLYNAEINTSYTIYIIKESGKTAYSHSCIAKSKTLACDYSLQKGIYIVSIIKQNSVLSIHKIHIE